MNKNKLRDIYFVFFKILLLLAGIISIKNQIWINLILVLITFFLIYFPCILKYKLKKSFPSKMEILILILIYITIFFETNQSLKLSDLWFRIIFHLLVSLIIGIIGFSLIYILNKSENKLFNLNPFFMALFAFCFSISIGLSWQIFRYLMDYIFAINIQNFNPSDSLGFLSVHSFGAGIVSIIAYFHLTNNSKNSFVNKIMRIFVKKNIDKNENQKILKLIKKGENEKMEFKETLRLNIHTNSYDKQMGHSVLKSITAFLNTKGGILLVGVSDDGEIKGIEREDFKNNDRFLLYFNNLFKKHIGNEFIPFISYDIIKISNKSVFKVECNKSNKEVFLKDGNLEEFFIRTGPASVLVEGSKLVEYIQRRFR